MLKANSHIIDKIFVEVNASGEDEAVQIKNDVSTFLREKVLPEIEITLNRLSGEGQVYRFDKVDLAISAENWNDAVDINNQIEKQLTEKINTVTSEFIFRNKTGNHSSVKIVNGEQTEVSSSQNLQNIFLYFLEHAHLPWYGRKEQLEQLISSEKWDKAFLASLEDLLSGSQAATKRFVFQLPVTNVLHFVQLFEKVKFRDEKSLLGELKRMSISVRNQLLELFVLMSVSDREKDWFKNYERVLLARVNEFGDQKLTAEQILNKLEKQIKEFIAKDTYERYFVLTKDQRDAVLALIGQQLQTDPQKRGLAQNKSSIIENNPTIISGGISFNIEKEPLFFDSEISGLAVQNAGQVLFHLFVPSLFKHFDWIDEQGKIREKCIDLAVQALHYCASGQEDFFEGDLILEKFLCGLSLSATIPAESLLSEEIKSEADSMLKHLISHWPELKNTSPDGLRDLFIKRDGKLIQKDNGYKLMVERKAQDVLLENLQWNISVVKMPWSKKLLFVEW